MVLCYFPTQSLGFRLGYYSAIFLYFNTEPLDARGASASIINIKLCLRS